MAYIADTKANHTTSYWNVRAVRLFPRDNTAEILFFGFADKSARDGQGRKIGEKKYVVLPKDYPKYFADKELMKVNKTPEKQAYLYATDKLEENGKSFFDGASDV